MTTPDNPWSLAGDEPASDALLDRIRIVVGDLRGHQHAESCHCAPLRDWLLEQVPALLRRTFDERTAARHWEGQHTAAKQIFHHELDTLRARLGGVADSPRDGIPAVRIVDIAADARGLYGTELAESLRREPLPEHEYGFEVTYPEGGRTFHSADVALTAGDIVSDRGRR